MIRKNKLQIIVLIVLMSGRILNGQWIIEKAPTTYDLNSICLINQNSGWIVGDKGTMLYRSKSGWNSYQQVTGENLYSVFLIDEYSGWSVGSGGTILRLIGNEWVNVASPTSKTLFCVNFIDSEHGVASGADGTVIIYNNGEWTLLDKYTKGNLYSISMTDDISIIGGGLEYGSVPVMIMHENSGHNLVESLDPGYKVIKSIAAQNSENIWAVGRPGMIYHYDGNEWRQLPQFKKLPSLNSVSFADQNNGIAVGYDGTILTCSVNGWKRGSSPAKVKLNGSAISGNAYYAVGDNGIIISSVRQTDIINPPNKTHYTISIEPYPNPAPDVLNVIIPDEFNLSDGLVAITNAFGQVIFQQKLNSMTAGQIYMVKTSEFSAGLYLIKISTGDRIAIGKFIVKN